MPANQIDLTIWSVEWCRRAIRDGLPFDIEFTDPRNGEVVIHLRYRSHHLDLTLNEPVTQEELEGTLNMMGWTLRYEAGEITKEEFRVALGLPVGEAKP